MKKGQQSGKTGRADRTQYPMWSVTRCERTEVPPLRDGDNTTQPYRSRTVTTTECVRIVQIPIDIGETNFSVEPIPDKTERKISSKTIMHGVPVVSGLTAEGGLLCNGIQTTPEMTETTTLITTTTTAYNVLEIDNEAPDIKTPDSAIILNTPCDQEYQERQKQNKRYVIIDKKPSPTSTGQIPGHVVKLIDIVMPGETGGEKQEHLEKITKIYDENNACEGTIASISKTYEIQNEPIERYVRTYHNRYFREEKEKAETLERRKIEQQTVYSNHNTNEVRLYDDQMLPERIRLPLQQYFENNVSHGSLTRTSHYTINKIQQKKESKRKNTNKKGINEADILTAAIQGPKIMGNMKFGDAHMDYPVSSAYEGPLDETDRIRDIEGEPLEQHVT
ncbi:unnamed protein product, partial [Dracunculus medinensis]|uniref:Uncharacterized protein n=1 Tax=Dracunculus medinensis TaxID=318479 RepID=A0A0N4U8V1_DRAME